MKQGSGHAEKGFFSWSWCSVKGAGKDAVNQLSCSEALMDVCLGTLSLANSELTTP